MLLPELGTSFFCLYTFRRNSPSLALSCSYLDLKFHVFSFALPLSLCFTPVLLPSSFLSRLCIYIYSLSPPPLSLPLSSFLSAPLFCYSSPPLSPPLPLSPPICLSLSSSHSLSPFCISCCVFSLVSPDVLP